ncbi:MAG: AAA family ATPase [Actinobacteria bacterium]|nr:AAA family ATPase [Actinomycetota bacterium]
MTVDSELEAEQAYIDHAYRCLDEARARANQLQNLVEVGRGGTEQARFEREVIFDTIANRLAHLHLGDQSLCFGRIDTEPSNGDGSGDRFYIGRIAVSDANQEPVIVDWRAPVAEAFYRATGRVPMGLARRRHFITRGRELLDIDDELFGEHATATGAEGRLRGQGALIAALETARSGRLGDIVGTIQAEQDEIIRSPLPGVLVVQGGPGTGKTVVALHRAAYLLYSHRFPLEDQGVLVVGPNRLFLAYIEQVLPSLGEAGVELVVLADLVDSVRVRGNDEPVTARIKGDARMGKVVAKAVRDRERPLREDLRVGHGLQILRVEAERTQRIVSEARRRYRFHNSGRRYVEHQLFEALAESSRSPLDPGQLRVALRHAPEVREALERMWPVLTPAELLNDLFGSIGLLRLAAGSVLSDGEIDALRRPRRQDVDDVVFTQDDVPLLDEARARLGATPRSKRHGEDDEPRTYGHIVVDEAQDLSPMQLRMLTRRSLNGSMTVVGDIAQSTGAWAHAGWEEVLALLPQRRPARRAELTIGYRIPAPNMALAARVLRDAAPDLRPPTSVRRDGRPPRFVGVDGPDLGAAVAAAVRDEIAEVGQGNVGVICPGRLVPALTAALAEGGIDHGVAVSQGLDHQVTIVPVLMAKGLELDATVVVEPATIVADEAQGLRALYVALTRATKALTVVHAEPLPAVLAE